MSPPKNTGSAVAGHRVLSAILPEALKKLRCFIFSRYQKLETPKKNSTFGQNHIYNSVPGNCCSCVFCGDISTEKRHTNRHTHTHTHTQHQQNTQHTHTHTHTHRHRHRHNTQHTHHCPMLVCLPLGATRTDRHAFALAE